MVFTLCLYIYYLDYFVGWTWWQSWSGTEPSQQESQNINSILWRSCLWWSTL